MTRINGQEFEQIQDVIETNAPGSNGHGGSMHFNGYFSEGDTVLSIRWEAFSQQICTELQLSRSSHGDSNWQGNYPGV
jgi:hypothetical protein